MEELIPEVPIPLCTERSDTGICGHAVFRQIVGMVKALSTDERRRTARLLGYFTRMTGAGQYDAIEQVGILTEIPRFRKPEPEIQPAPLTVRLPLKEDK